MLAEALLYARARLGGQQNRHGHLTEQVAIWARHRRQRQAWAGHLAQARALCLHAAQGCPAHRTALVLGAGLLLDVPLEQLSALFRRVVLADMAFLPATVRQAKALGNVELVVTDLTGCLDHLPNAQDLAARLEVGPAPRPDLSLGLDALDFVYSANILSQLPLHAVSALRAQQAHAGWPDAAAQPSAALEAFAASLVRAHLDALQALPCPACLVADTLERGYEGQTLRYEADLLHGVAPGLEGQHWTWPLAPPGEISPHLRVERLVLGAPNVHLAAKAPAAPAPGGPHA